MPNPANTMANRSSTDSLKIIKQLLDCYSWRLNPEEITTDLFNQDWAQTREFANIMLDSTLQELDY